MLLLPLLEAAGGVEGFASLFVSDDGDEEDDLVPLSEDPLPLDSEFLEEDLDEE